MQRRAIEDRNRCLECTSDISRILLFLNDRRMMSRYSDWYPYMRCLALLSSRGFIFPRSWEIRLTRNKRGERSERVRSWRKDDKIGVADGIRGIYFARTFEVRRPGGFRATRQQEAIPRNKTRSARRGCKAPAPRQLKTHDWEAYARRRAVVGATSREYSFVAAKRVSRSCNQMPDWIISIIWNVYGVDKDPWCTSCRSLRRRTRERFELDRRRVDHFICAWW